MKYVQEMQSRREKPAGADRRNALLMGAGAGLLAGLIPGWILFGFSLQMAAFVLILVSLGHFLALELVPSSPDTPHAPPSALPSIRMRDTPKWRRIRRASRLLFVTFIHAALLASTVGHAKGNNLLEALAALFGGMALLAGSGLLLAIRGRLRDGWIFAFALGVWVVATAVTAMLSEDSRPTPTLALVSLAVLGIAFGVAVLLNRRLAPHQDDHLGTEWP